MLGKMLLFFITVSLLVVLLPSYGQKAQRMSYEELASAAKDFGEGAVEITNGWRHLKKTPYESSSEFTTRQNNLKRTVISRLSKYYRVNPARRISVWSEISHANSYNADEQEAVLRLGNIFLFSRADCYKLIVKSAPFYKYSFITEHYQTAIGGRSVTRWRTRFNLNGLYNVPLSREAARQYDILNRKGGILVTFELTHDELIPTLQVVELDWYIDNNRISHWTGVGTPCYRKGICVSDDYEESERLEYEETQWRYDQFDQAFETILPNASREKLLGAHMYPTSILDFSPYPR